MNPAPTASGRIGGWAGPARPRTTPRRHGRRPGRARNGGYVLLGVVLTLLMAAAVAYQMGRESALNVNMADGEARSLQARYVAEAGLAYAAAQLNASGACSAPAAGSAITGQIGADSFSVTSTTLSSNPLRVALTSTPTLAASGTAAATAFAPLVRQVVLYSQAQQQTVLTRHYAGVVKDTFIAHKLVGRSGGNSANMGADVKLILDKKDQVSNMLLHFDLVGALPASAKLASARLVLTPVWYWPNGGNRTDITVHEVTRAWAEGSGTIAAPATVSSGATWDQAQPGVAWGYVPYLAPASVNTPTGISSGGGDYDPAYADRAYVNAGAPASTYSWDVTALAAQWIADPAANFGMLLKSEENLQQGVFASSESMQREQRPQLVLTSWLPCGGPTVTLALLDLNTTLPITVATVDTPVLLRMVLANPAPAVATLNASLNVALPAGFSVESPSQAVLSGCGSMRLTAPPGATSLSLSGGSIAATSGTAPGLCTVSVAVSGATPSGSATLASGPTGAATSVVVPAGALATSRGSNAAAASASLYVVPLPTLAADTFIDDDNDKSKAGAATTLQLRNDKKLRVLLRFSGLPATGVPVQTATLRIFVRSVVNPQATSTVTLKPYLMETPWSESNAMSDDDNPWDKNGGDFLSSPSLPTQSLGSLQTLTPQWVDFDVVAGANAWTGGLRNDGLILLSTKNASSTRDNLQIDSRERSGGNRAQLRMTY